MGVLSEDLKDRIRAHIPRYPHKQAVTLPALHLVHDALRCVPLEAVREIATHVAEVTASGRPTAAILAQLGPPEALARAYLADYFLQRRAVGFLRIAPLVCPPSLRQCSDQSSPSATSARTHRRLRARRRDRRPTHDPRSGRVPTR